MRNASLLIIWLFELRLSVGERDTAGDAADDDEAEVDADEDEEFKVKWLLFFAGDDVVAFDIDICIDDSISFRWLVAWPCSGYFLMRCSPRSIPRARTRTASSPKADSRTARTKRSISSTG